MERPKYSMAGQYIGLGLSFGVTMAVSIIIAGWAGNWIDMKLGLDNGIFKLIGILCGIFSGFRVFIDNVEQMHNPIDPNERE